MRSVVNGQLNKPKEPTMNINIRPPLIARQAIIALTCIAFIGSKPQRGNAQSKIGSTKEKVSIQVDLKKPIGPMYPVWAWFGYDEPNYTYMKDGKKLLSEIAQLSP